MSKGAYIGIGGTARKVKKMYVGIDGVARRIKKAYIGIGGVARPCFSGEPIEYWGITYLFPMRGSLAATTVGNYALFGGGYNGNYKDAVDIFNTSVTSVKSSNLSVARGSLAATTVGNYALFGGGETDTSEMDTVDAFNTSGTLIKSTNLSKARRGLTATTVGNYAFFGGGTPKNALFPQITVDVFDTSATYIHRRTPQSL